MRKILFAFISLALVLSLLSSASALYNPDNGVFGSSSDSSSSHSDSNSVTDYQKTTTTTITEHKQVKTDANNNQQNTQRQTNSYPSYGNEFRIYQPSQISYQPRAHYQTQPIANTFPSYNYVFPSAYSHNYPTSGTMYGMYSNNPSDWRNHPVYNSYNYPANYNTYTTPYYYEPTLDWHSQIYNWDY